jgi:hypothetical protein
MTFWRQSSGGRYENILPRTHAYLYRDFFEFAREITSEKIPVTFVLSNSDIAFDESLGLLPCLNATQFEAHALTRQETKCDWPCLTAGCYNNKCDLPAPASFDGFASIRKRV